ncbi:recombinase family protein [Streptomyces sp. NPDC004227]
MATPSREGSGSDPGGLQAASAQRDGGPQRRLTDNRIARSLIDLVTMVDTLRERGLEFKVLTGALANIDPGTADGRLMLQVVGAMAEFERSLIKEHTRAGLDAAKAQGRTGGRPSVVNEDVLTVARARKAKGESVSAIAKALGVSRATLYRHLGDDS